MQIRKVKKEIGPLTGRGGLQGCEMLRFPHWLDNRLTDECKVVRRIHRPRFTPHKHFSASGTRFCLRLSNPQGVVRPEGRQTEKINSPHRVWNPRPSGLQPSGSTTTLPRAGEDQSAAIVRVATVLSLCAGPRTCRPYPIAASTSSSLRPQITPCRHEDMGSTIFGLSTGHAVA
jgi:hypothetical protein